jgi:rfaE bifunctional protein kinase chain/domain
MRKFANVKHNKHTDRLRHIINTFPEVTVTVVGDFVADEFIFGEIARVSREAPVLILKFRERTVVPGGGANAVFNLADLGVNVLPVGVVGNDEPGRLLLQRFRQKRIAISGVQKARDYSTVTKTRVLAGMAHNTRQQVVRYDREPDAPPSPRTVRELILAARKFVRASDAVLVSDYGYGAATPEILKLIAPGDLPVTVDSRYRMLEYVGVTAATPNEPEVEEALGVKIGHDQGKLHWAANELMRRMKLDSVLITRGRDGMLALEKKHKPIEIPIHGSDQVTDVTGAGDTVIATFTAALAARASTEEAARLANYAGGIVVMKRGTATVMREELLAAVES